MLEGVFDSGKPFIATDQLIRFDSQGRGVEDNFYDLVYQPLCSEDGPITGIVVVAVEITERVRMIGESDHLLAQMKKARADAEAANRSKSEFLAVMSHELRTPLQAINAYAELLMCGQQGPVTAAQTAAFGAIQRSERYLLSIIDGVLDYAKADAGAVSYAMEDVALTDVLRSCEALTMPQLRAKGLVFEFHECNPHLHARADREKMERVIVNLLSNAIKFTDGGGVISVSCHRDGDERLAIQVKDTGRGIDGSELERIFLPFVQLRAAAEDHTRGTGLGLAISRDLARGMGGDLMVDSTPGAGSVFTFTVPAA